jgi:carbon-monoxide dehydrogenase medium subunit
MKAAAFDYQTPASLDEAVRLLAQSDGAAKIIAGGQSLGPMLNLRLAQPSLLIAVRQLKELRAVEESADAVALGACITHAEIEDARVPDPTNGLLPFVARRIAYRAVRNRGTIGGSLAHADPAADWVSALALAGATVTVQGPRGGRNIAASELLVGAFETKIAPDEILVRVSIPKFSARAQWSYYKICRKTGEFADAIAGVLVDPARGVRRAVIGATAGAPIVIDGDAPWRGAAAAALQSAGLHVDHKGSMLDVALRRAAERIAA